MVLGSRILFLLTMTFPPGLPGMCTHSDSSQVWSAGKKRVRGLAKESHLVWLKIKIRAGHYDTRSHWPHQMDTKYLLTFRLLIYIHTSAIYCSFAQILLKNLYSLRLEEHE